jgi:hypothetical protein
MRLKGTGESPGKAFNFGCAIGEYAPKRSMFRQQAVTTTVSASILAVIASPQSRAKMPV